MALKDHPHIVSIEYGIDLKPDGGYGYVVTINTKLALNVTDPKHDADAVIDLINASSAHMKQFGSLVNKIQIRQC